MGDPDPAAALPPGVVLVELVAASAAPPIAMRARNSQFSTSDRNVSPESYPTVP